MNRFVTTASAAAIAASLLPAAAFAQEGGRNVETITVTAQQREQSQQDVPLSVAAYDEQLIQDSGIRDIKDLTAIAPGLLVTSTQSETITTARIRGLGTVGDNFGLESSVGVYIDGVFRARNGVGFGDLGEIERIEVLRGPQGTLFGKNTSAGVINVITKRPEFEYGGQGEVSVGNFNYLRYSGAVTGPIVEDELAFRIFGARGERDGYTDLVIGQGPDAVTTDSENQDYWTTRAQLLWTPNANFDLNLIADYSDRDEFCCSAVQWDFTDSAAGLVQLVGGSVLNPADPDERIAFANTPFVQEVEDWGLSGEANWDLGFGTLTSVTAYRSWENRRSQDIDYSSADIANRLADRNFTEIERFSQEVRLTGLAGDLDWLVGGFFSQEDLTLGDGITLGADWEAFLGNAVSLGAGGGPAPTFIVDTQNGIGSVFVPGYQPIAPGQAIPNGAGPIQDLYEQEATSFAVFTHNTYALTDAFDITFGVRFTSEEKDNTATFQTSAVPGCAFYETLAGPELNVIGTPLQDLAAVVPLVCLPYTRSSLDATGYDQSRTDEEVSGTLRASYRFNPDVLGYAGYSRGFKAGGFNLDRQFNGTAVDTNGDGRLDSIADVDTSFAPEIVDSFEVGVKSEWLNNALLLNANLFFQQVEDFQLNTFNGIAFVVDSIEEIESMGAEVDFLYLTPIDGLDLQGGFAWVDSEYGDFDTGDPRIDALSGQQTSLSPEFFLTGAVSYERPLTANLVSRFHLDSRWVSEYNTGSDLDPEKEQDAFTLVNARVGVGATDGRWMLELWGRNLTDETYAQVAFDAFAQGSRDGAGTSIDPRGTAGYDAFLAAPLTWGATIRTEF